MISFALGAIVGILLSFVAITVGRKTGGLTKLPKIYPTNKQAEIISNKDDIEEFLNG